MTTSRPLHASAIEPATFAPFFSSSAAFVARAVVDDELVTAAQDARGHGLTHSAEADETDFHCVFSAVCSA